jgi:hypothetical protein
MATPLSGTDSAAGALQRVRYSHDAMIDLILAHPQVTQGQLAEHFNYTQAWISRIMNSDAFQARLAERKTELVDPTIIATLEEKFRVTADLSLEIVMSKLEAQVKLPASAQDGKFALAALEVSQRALGFGARQAPGTVNQTAVVIVPAKAESQESWVESAQRAISAAASGGMVMDVQVKEKANG